MDIFFELHAGLPREGPGSDACTRQALSCFSLPPGPRVLDIGCGPGMQTLVLAKETGGTVTAVDRHRPFLDELRRRAQNSGLSDRIVTVEGDMRQLPFDGESFDLVWSEGAVYIMGFDCGLETWRQFLVPGGGLAVTELSWLTDDRPSEAMAFWQENYPAMASVEQNLTSVVGAGYKPITHFVLPATAWWEDYYLPLRDRIATLRDQYAGDAAIQQALDQEAAEISLFEKYSGHYGYVFYLMSCVP